jgi:phosphoglycerate dehydrogenase-like enzyme
MIAPAEKTVICFAHVAYRLQERFAALDTGVSSFAVRDPEALEKRVDEADVLAISGLWQNQLLDQTERLRFIQSIGAGTDQFPREELARRGIRLASTRGVNARAVAEHAMAAMLALSRRLPEAGDNQRQRIWRGMIGDLSQREDEIGGKTLLIVGLGDIGGRLARLAKAFDMRVAVCGAIRVSAEVRRMRCTLSTSSTRSCPMPISWLLPVRLPLKPRT